MYTKSFNARWPTLSAFSQVEALLSGVTDAYYQKVGLRTVRATESQLLVNEKPFYLMGFGKHEDASVRDTEERYKVHISSPVSGFRFGVRDSTCRLSLRTST